VLISNTFVTNPPEPALSFFIIPVLIENINLSRIYDERGTIFSYIRCALNYSYTLPINVIDAESLSFTTYRHNNSFELPIAYHKAFFVYIPYIFKQNPILFNNYII